MYESLRQLIRHSQAGEAEAVFAAMDLAFAIDLCKEEGSGQVKEDCVGIDLNIVKCMIGYYFKKNYCFEKSKVQWPEHVATGTD